MDLEIRLKTLIKEKLYNNFQYYWSMKRHKWITIDYNEKGVYDYGATLTIFEKADYDNDFWKFLSDTLITLAVRRDSWGFPRDFHMEPLDKRIIASIVSRFITDKDLQKNLISKLGKINEGYAIDGDGNSYPMFIDGETHYYYLHPSGS